MVFSEKCGSNYRFARRHVSVQRWTIRYAKPQDVSDVVIDSTCHVCRMAHLEFLVMVAVPSVTILCLHVAAAVLRTHYYNTLQFTGAHALCTDRTSTS